MKMKNPYMVKVLYKVKIYKITVLMLPRKKKKTEFPKFLFRFMHFPSIGLFIF